MNKFLKIVYVFLYVIIITIITGKSFAGYNYLFILNAYNLTRDNLEITYLIEKSESEYTNKDVTLKINFNKPIYEIDGFSISEDRKVLTKNVTENEKNTITVEDVSGNKKDVLYAIDNIDKIPPEIIGIEDGKTYTNNVTLNYRDNIGIKEINIDKYDSLKISLYDDYYDTSFFKGIDLTDSTAKIRVIQHPKNTQKYKYYINNLLKAETKDDSYKFVGLQKGTSYQIKVEAIDEKGNVIETATRNIKTKIFSKVEGIKNSDGIFNVTVSGIDESINSAIAIVYRNEDGEASVATEVRKDRSINVVFSAKSITTNVKDGYYYFHIQLWADGKHIDTVCCNVIFNQNYSEENQDKDLYNLTQNGNYQIIVTDLAGNMTEKCITIKK